MQVMARESWTDERLDDLNAKVDRGFEQVDQRFEQVDKRFEQIDKRFEQVDRRFERVEDEFKAVRLEMKEGFDMLNRAILTLALVIFSGMFAGFAGLIATQL